MTSESDRSDSVPGEAQAPGDAPRHWTAEDVARVLRKGVGVDGSVVRRARELLGRHQNQGRLAKQLGYQPETISRWERSYWPVPRVVQLALVALLDPLGRTAREGMLTGMSTYRVEARAKITVEGMVHPESLIRWLIDQDVEYEKMRFLVVPGGGMAVTFCVAPEDVEKVCEWLRDRPAAAPR